jgi:phosphatidylserine/phosphatidylglycerophosphate/cardiolipin synthase-like enzyme
MENARYFEALAAALPMARKSILVIGWQFDPRTRLIPAGSLHDRGTEIGHLLRRLQVQNPDLQVKMLIWRSPLIIAWSQGFFPQKSVAWFKRKSIDFRLDRARPIGGCHHQKVVVIDDCLAFTGGGDISVDRWDSPEHFDRDPARATPAGRICPPRHEVMTMMDGPAARALGDLARQRWLDATGERLEPCAPDEHLWPEGWTPDFREVEVGIARTEPAWRGRPAIRENERLHLEGIRRAKRLIYLENQYFTSPVIAAAIAERLEEKDGPEVVIVSTARAPSWFDHAAMDGARSALVQRLRKADLYGRLSLWTPLTRGGAPIIVHSKVTAIDDLFLRVGSTNLNNRSCGFDTEVDVAWEAEWEGDDVSLAIHRFRSHLLAHFLGVDADAVEQAHGELDSLGAAIAALNTEGRMKAFPHDRASRLAEFIAEWQLGDPSSPQDAWRPWRRARLSRMFRETVAQAAEAAAAEPAPAAATGSISKSTISGR